jgi:diguanylate cyclase (GGDEF)-like protein/PAS domain S-box-containing protein
MEITLKTYGEFLKTIPDAAAIVNQQGILVVVNPQAEALFGYPLNVLYGKPLEILLPKSISPAHAKMVEGYFAHPKTRVMGSGMAIKGRHADGHEFPMDIMLKPIEFEENLYALCVMRDITAVKEQEAQLQRALAREHEQALTDYLTGIANARAFHISLEAEMNRLARFERPFTLVYLDLDHFKVVNDEKGHAEGDRVLCTVADVIKLKLRKTDFFARMGGDEFAILFPETTSDIANTLINNLKKYLAQAMQQHKWGVTFSIGVLTCFCTVDSVDELIKMADELMYEVKKHGKNDVKYSVLGSAKT